MELQNEMFSEMRSKSIFKKAKKMAFEYADQIEYMDVFPSALNISRLRHFDEKLPETQTSGEDILEFLREYGSPGTTAQTGGRYFGFVNGGAIPASLAVKWLSDFWDQNGGLFHCSPLNAKLELVCQEWLKELFGLPKETVAGFVSGTSTANLCAVVAARYRLMKRLNWDVNTKGLRGAPAIRIVAHDQVHASIKKTLAILGLGLEDVEWVPSDNQGRMILSKVPKLDYHTLLLLQAGNANTGSFDHFDKLCDMANKAGAWIHIDGAFGLWAAASESLSYLTNGMEKATSWAVDGHKSLNTPYDCGIVLCKDEEALVNSLQANGEYIVLSDDKEPMLYTTEMSKRSRAIELWATMKYLGKSGIDELITGLYIRAEQLEQGLRAYGFDIINKVVFNQVLVACETEELTAECLKLVQQSGKLWCGGSKWDNKIVIRLSVCSWATTSEDINLTIDTFAACRDKAKIKLSKASS